MTAKDVLSSRDAVQTLQYARCHDQSMKGLATWRARSQARRRDASRVTYARRSRCCSRISSASSSCGRIKLIAFGAPLDGPPPMAQPAPCGTLSISGGIVKQAAQKATNPIDKHVGGRVRMRRMMLGMSQSTLADGLGLTFQQVQKYEKGTNRIGASRLQHISHILQIPVPFFFEGAPQLPGQPQGIGEAPWPAYVSEFLATIDGLALTTAFMKIKEPRLRRGIVALVEEIAGY